MTEMGWAGLLLGSDRLHLNCGHLWVKASRGRLTEYVERHEGCEEDERSAESPGSEGLRECHVVSLGNGRW